MLRADAPLVERFVRASMMGFHYSRDNRGGAIKVLSKSLRIDDGIAAKVYDSSRPTMTADGTSSEEAQKKMAAFVAKSAGFERNPADGKGVRFLIRAQSQRGAASQRLAAGFMN